MEKRMQKGEIKKRLSTLPELQEIKTDGLPKNEPRPTSRPERLFLGPILISRNHGIPATLLTFLRTEKIGANCTAQQPAVRTSDAAISARPTGRPALHRLALPRNAQKAARLVRFAPKSCSLQRGAALERAGKSSLQSARSPAQRARTIRRSPAKLVVRLTCRSPPCQAPYPAACPFAAAACPSAAAACPSSVFACPSPAAA